jgi:hypothetical protein
MCPAEPLPQVDGKRVSAPTIVGPGVASLHPCSAPPPAMHSVDVSVLIALQQAASEKLATYKTRVAQSCGSLSPSDKA